MPQPAPDTPRTPDPHIDHLAAAMADAVVAGGSCTRDDLLRVGFAAAAIDAHAEAARAKASAILARRGLSEIWVGDHVGA